MIAHKVWGTSYSYAGPLAWNGLPDNIRSVGRGRSCQVSEIASQIILLLL